MSGEEPAGFLSRWSRRKRGEALPEPEPEAAAPPAEMPLAETPLAEAPLAEAPPPEPPAEPEFDLTSLPPIETLDASSDFTVFLKPGVPAALRQAALRRAWMADPLIRDHMGSLDYAWDFNTPGGLPHGFSNVLAETGEALRKLISQAIGEIEPEAEEAEKPPAVALAEAPPPALPVEEPPPALPLAALPTPVLATPVWAEAAPEPPPPPRRRHGGALPA